MASTSELAEQPSVACQSDASRTANACQLTAACLTSSPALNARIVCEAVADGTTQAAKELYCLLGFLIVFGSQ